MNIDWRPRHFEVLVVTGIIIGLWLVLFTRVRSIKRGETCQSNLKKTALALGLYVRDFDELYPPKENWVEAVSIWIKDDSVFHCPSVPRYGYAMNQILGGIHASEITDYHTTPLFFETSLLHRNAAGGTENVIHEPRHPQGIGVVFTDQQVRWQQKPSQFPSLKALKRRSPSTQ